MWYPEILNEMAHYIETNPENGVTLCSALASTQQEATAQIFNNTQVCICIGIIKYTKYTTCSTIKLT